MILVRKSSDRGHANHGWLNAKHTFSFGGYVDPDFMGFSVLRVINEDQIAGGRGFAPHSHNDMEIMTYMIDGSLEHKDSMGNSSTIQPGEIQRMSAGTGVTHSEYNASPSAPAHLLQIWILPDKKGHPPSYEQVNFQEGLKAERHVLIASKNGTPYGVRLNQNIDLAVGLLDAKETREIPLRSERKGWLQLVRGSLLLEDQVLSAGDGAAIQDQSRLKLKGEARSSEYLFFDLP